MSQPYVGEIRMFGGNFAPAGWALCQGQLIPISGYETLFNLIGTTYGGDGQSTFAVPNLSSRLPIHQGSGFTIGQNGGVENVTLNLNQIPAHTHSVLASPNASNSALPGGNYLSKGPDIYDVNTAGTAVMAANISNIGGNVAHSNIQPYLAINFILSLFGVFPSPS